MGCLTAALFQYSVAGLLNQKHLLRFNFSPRFNPMVRHHTNSDRIYLDLGAAAFIFQLRIAYRLNNKLDNNCLL